MGGGSPSAPVIHRQKVTKENHSRALAGETVARDWVNAAYGARATPVAVMIRKSGVPVLDWLVDVGNGEFVVVEAKAAGSQLGRTMGREVVFDPSGLAHVVTIGDEVQRFSPPWFRQCIDELMASGQPVHQDLARKLERSWRQGKIRPLLIRAPIPMLGTLASGKRRSPMHSHAH